MIVGVRGREVLDSRGRPTVEAELELSDGTTVIASVPSGASTGRHEAVERRDGDRRGTAAEGCAVPWRRSTGDRPSLRLDASRTSAAIDGTLIELDGTPDKSRLGANATLAVSLAVARAAAARAGRPAVAQPRRGRAGHAAAADGQHHQRRAARRAAARLPGLPRHPVGAGSFARRSNGACGPRRAGALLAERGLTDAAGRRGRLRAAAGWPRGALELLDQAVDPRRSRARASTSSTRSTSRRHTSSTGRAGTRLRRRGATLHAGEIAELDRRARRAAPDRFGRGSARRGRLGRLGGVHRAARRPHPDRRRRPLHDEPRAARARHRAAVPRTRCS